MTLYKNSLLVLTTTKQYAQDSQTPVQTGYIVREPLCFSTAQLGTHNLLAQMITDICLITKKTIVPFTK